MKPHMKSAVNVPVCAKNLEYSMFVFRENFHETISTTMPFASSYSVSDGLADLDHIMAGTGPTKEGFSALTGLAVVTEVVYLSAQNAYRPTSIRATAVESIRVDGPHFRKLATGGT